MKYNLFFKHRNKDFAVTQSHSQSIQKTGRNWSTQLQYIPPEEDDYDYAVWVLGATGVGKSTLCNFFFQSKLFKTQSGLLAVTSESHSHCHCVNNTVIKFIDSPGYSDTKLNSKSYAEEMSKALLQASNGVHAIAVCVNGAGRFTEADALVIEELDKLESIWKHTFVIFTHGENMGEQEKERKKEVMSLKSHTECPPKLKELLDKVQDRFMVLESRNSHDQQYYYEKCDEFITHIETVYGNNDKSCYTHMLFSWARDAYNEAMQKRPEISDKLTQQKEDTIIKLIGELETVKNEVSSKEKYISQQEEELRRAKKQKEEKDEECIKKESKIKEIERMKSDQEKEMHKMQQQLQGAEKELKEIFEKNRIQAQTESVKDAILIMSQEIDQKSKELTQKSQEIQQKSGTLHAYEDYVEHGCHSIFGFPLPFNVKIGFYKRKIRVSQGDDSNA